MQYRYFERPSTGDRTAAIFSGEPLQAETAASQAADIAAALGWGEDVRAVTVEEDPGPGNIALPEPPAPAPTPDPNGFLLAAMGALGLARGNTLLTAWPTFTVAIGAANWGVARAVLDAATTDATVTAEERTMLLALFTQYGIPEA